MSRWAARAIMLTMPSALWSACSLSIRVSYVVRRDRLWCDRTDWYIGASWEYGSKILRTACICVWYISFI